MESKKQENEKICRNLKEKEDNVAFLSEKLKNCMEELAVLENRFVLENERTRFVKTFKMNV